MKRFAATVRGGENLLAALYRDGHFLEATCGGQGRCRRCRVQIEAGPGVEPTRTGSTGGWTLACQVETPGEYRVRVARPMEMPQPNLPLGPSSGRELGLAVDLGTTTLAVALVDLATRETKIRFSRPNPQAAYGTDVLARIGFARDPEHRARLAELVRRGVADLAGRALRELGASARDIRKTTLAGNASMMLLSLLKDAECLARFPFEPGLAQRGAIETDATIFGLPKGTVARFLPALGGHVGGDTTAGILASGLPEGELPALLVDLGTNGEVALATTDGILVASSAAGPAFEGGSIEHGSAAGPGAVERAERRGNGLALITVDGSPPRTWCGSGVIEVTAALRDLGFVDAGGRMVQDPALVPPFTPSDVREVQLAKGAVAAAIRILAQEAGIRPFELRRLVLTGAFGHHLSPEPARRIGLVPVGVPVESLDGGALAGAALALFPDDAEQARAIAAQVRHVSLGDRPDFQEVFVASLSLTEWTE